MVDVDSLSDAELRTKLLEYGYPIMPITATTRNIMVKKLKLLMNNNEGKIQRRRTLANFSSEDDSENETLINKKNKAANLNNSLMRPPKALAKKSSKVTKDPVNDDQSKTEPKVTSSSTYTSSTVKSRRTFAGFKDDFDTGSDSESEILRSPNNKSFKTSSKALDFPIRSRTSLYSSGSSYSKSTLDPLNDNNYAETLSRPTATSSFILNDSPDSINSIRSRLGYSSSGYESPYLSYLSRTPAVSEDVPFLSNFTRRLSQLSSMNKPSYDLKNDAIQEHDRNGSGYKPSFAPGLQSRSRTHNNFYNGSTKSLILKNMVPVTVVGLALMFFIFIAVVYLGMRSDTHTQSATVVSQCDSSNSSHIPGINCVEELDIRPALVLLDIIQSELHKRAVQKLCYSNDVMTRMNEMEIVNFVLENSNLEDPSKLLSDLRNVEVIILHSPKLKMDLVKIADKDNIKINALENIGLERMTSPIYFTILNPDLPWSCIFYNHFYFICRTIFIISLILVGLYTLRTCYNYYHECKQKHRNEVFNLVERIIDILQSRTDEENDFIVINHVRDVIIPIAERKSKQHIWNEAVDFINETESRVRKEVQVVQGEEYSVWRWVGVDSLTISRSPRNTKSWQGQAFETQIGSVNSLPCSPSPCLKIRGMVEDGDRNTQMIREAVLSKCGPKCRILHCVVDTSMKCVYLRCADTSDAATAYHNLHGWWYSGQLVTVKYIRLERYSSRFPDCPSTGPYLKATKPITDWTN